MFISDHQPTAGLRVTGHRPQTESSQPESRAHDITSPPTHHDSCTLPSSHIRRQSRSIDQTEIQFSHKSIPPEKGHQHTGSLNERPAPRPRASPQNRKSVLGQSKPNTSSPIRRASRRAALRASAAAAPQARLRAQVGQSSESSGSATIHSQLIIMATS